MIKFEKVPFNTFLQSADVVEWIAPDVLESPEFWVSAYQGLDLPKRATKHSAGYDFHTPFAFTLKPGKTIIIPTGVRCIMPEDRVLLIAPRSGLGFRFRIGLANTLAVIDADFVNSETLGHIMLKLVNDGDKPVYFRQNDRICQGIIVRYDVTDDDDADGERTGGLGSTGVAS